MKTKRLFLQSFRSLFRHRLRTFFIMLSSIVGIAALTFVLSVGQGAQQKMMSTVRQIFGDSSIIVIAGGQEVMGGPRADAARLTIDDIEAVAKAVPEVETWDPQQALFPTVRHGNASSVVRVLGQSERSEQVWGRTVSRGNYFDATAVKQLERVALIGETTARALFGNDDPIGSEILIEAAPFTVIGVLEHFGTDFHGMDRDNEIVVPVSTLMRRLANVDTIALAKFKIHTGQDLGAATASVKQALRNRHSLVTGQPDDFNLLTPVVIQKMVGKIRQILSVYLPLASVVVLLVGGIVAATLMVSSVNARTGEIGLRRAVGALPEDIARQFLIETVLSLVAGGVIGVVIGLVGGELVAAHLKLVSGISLTAMVIGLTASAVTGLVAGVLPARRAARLLPVEALR
jgi:putative ABC transport system permease protein